jgi:hypothetical protein
VAFKRRFYVMDSRWASRIFDEAWESHNLPLASALMRLYSHYRGVVYTFCGYRLDRRHWSPNLHIPDDPTEEQAKV